MFGLVVWAAELGTLDEMGIVANVSRCTTFTSIEMGITMNHYGNPSGSTTVASFLFISKSRQFAHIRSEKFSMAMGF